MVDENNTIPINEEENTNTVPTTDTSATNDGDAITDTNIGSDEIAETIPVSKTSTKEDSTINPKDAVIKAYHYLREVTPSPEKISNVRIEEVTPLIVEDDKFWNVVLSYDAIGDLPFDRKREYKQFKIDSSTGKVISMKIHKI